MSLQIVGRKVWGAQHPDGFADAPLPAQEVWLHHSVTIAPDLVPPFDDDDAAIRTLERIGQERFGGGISYTFAVTPSGRTYEGHSIGRRGAHVAGRNSIARSICLVGDYSTRHPTKAQLEAVAALLTHGATQGWWLRAALDGGHRDAPGASTACPGDFAHQAIPAINTLARSPEDDMPLTDQDVARIAEAVWRRGTRNGWGHVVGAEQVLVGTEARVSHVQAALDQQVGGVDVDALADAVVERIAARLAQ